MDLWWQHHRNHCTVPAIALSIALNIKLKLKRRKHRLQLSLASFKGSRGFSYTPQWRRYDFSGGGLPFKNKKLVAYLSFLNTNWLPTTQHQQKIH